VVSLPAATSGPDCEYLDGEVALIFSRDNPAGFATDVLRTSKPGIEIPLSAAFDLDS